MPQAPYTPFSTVSPETRPTPQPSVSTPIAAFGGATAQALESVGANFERNELFSAAVQMKQYESEAKVNEAVTKSFIASGEVQNQFRIMEGKDPQDQLEAHVKNLAGIRESFKQNLTPYEQKLYDRETMRRFGYDVSNSGLHAATQLKKYNKDSYEASQIAILNNVLRDPNNEAYLDDAIKQTIDSEAKNTREEPPDLARMKIDAKVGRIVKGATGVLAKSNPDKADELLKKFEGKIPPADYLEAQQTIKDRAVQYYAALDARAVTGGTVPANHPAAQNAPVINKISEDKGWNVPGGTFTPQNIYRLVQQESGGQNLPPNKYGYAGYFQMKPSEFGLTPRDFAKMSFSEQLDLYANSYLKKYGYDGRQDLGVMNAAPAFGNAPDTTVAYPSGSPEAAANPSWVRYSGAGGAVTVGGIKSWVQAGGQGMESAPEVNLPDVARRGAEMAKSHPLIAGDPIAQEKYIENFLSHAQRNASLMRSQLNQQVRANRTAIDEVLFNASLGEKGPTSIEEANRIDPNFQQKWEDAAKLNPTISKHILDTFNYNAKQDVKMTNERFDRWQAAKGMAITNPEEFAKLSLASLDLPHAQYNQLHTEQLQMQKKAQDTTRIRSYLSEVQPQLADAGIYANNPAVYNQFVGGFSSEIAKAQEGGKMTTYEDRQGIAARLIRERGGYTIPYLGTFGGARGFDIPSDFVTPEMQDKFEKRWGHPPTPADIYRLYQLSKIQ